jgi:hypothetical protein
MVWHGDENSIYILVFQELVIVPVKLGPGDQGSSGLKVRLIVIAQGDYLGMGNMEEQVQVVLPPGTGSYHSYPGLLPGESFFLLAGGCIQPGGSGQQGSASGYPHVFHEISSVHICLNHNS